MSILTRELEPAAAPGRCARQGEGAAPPPIVPAVLGAAERRQLRRALGDASRHRRQAGNLLSRFMLTEVVNGVLAAGSLEALLARLVALAARTLEAERGTIFLYDADTDELVGRTALGGDIAEIRTPRMAGIAGAVFRSGRAERIAEAYADPRFYRDVDRRTGYHTRSLVAAPLLLPGDGPIGVIEVLNKRTGPFDAIDLALLQAIAAQVAAAIDRASRIELNKREQSRDQRLLELSQGIAAELRLDRLLEAIVEAAPRVLDAERASLFLHDPARDELWSRAVAGGRVETIRLPNGIGLAGASFTTRRLLNVEDAYADPRFYPAIDERSGYRTHTVLCAPIVDGAGGAAGVVEVLNKRRGRFTPADERRLRAFARQAAIALQNAQLFAEVASLKRHADTVLRAMSDGVVTLDASFAITKINEAARAILRLGPGEWLEGSAVALWGDGNPWLREALDYAARTGGGDHRTDVSFVRDGGEVANVNATVAPLRRDDGAVAGYTLVLEDITRQKKTHAVVTRYMAREFAERVLSSANDVAARSTRVATILFCDIRRFTSLAERLTAQATVDMLNEYFEEMSEVVSRHGGALDKYLGDGLIAVFGSQAGASAGAEDAVRAATEMLRRLGGLNRRRAERGAGPLAIGIGLASGEIVAGPVGSPRRADFTVIGDSVNLAARLESANKHYGTTVLVAGDTVRLHPGKPRLRSIDVIRVVGRQAATEVFELLEDRDEASCPRLAELLSVFAEGIAAYHARDWGRALDRFAQALRIAPEDGPSWVYTDRCLYYRDHPPPGHWDGVWAMQRK